MGNNGFDNFCNCENNDSKLEVSFRTSPNQNLQSSDRFLCPFVHTVIYQNYTIDNNQNNNNNNAINNQKNKRQKNKNNKLNDKNDSNPYEMNFEYHSIKSSQVGKEANTYKHMNKGFFNLNPINDEMSAEKKSSKTNENNENINNLIYNNQIIDNNSNNEENEENEEINEKEENTEIKNIINTKAENVESNIKLKHSKSHTSSENFENSETPTTNIDKPNKTPINGVDIQYLGKNTYYVGFIQCGVREGLGKMITGNNIYQGEFYNDQANGYGIYTKNGGELIYEGYWLNDEQNNFGIEKWNDGSSFFGEYSKQNKNGIGINLWKDGSQYEGEFKNNMFDGYGIYFFKKNKIYLGEWKSNKKHGYGEYIIDDKLYIGNFSMDERDGFGINYLKGEDKLFIGFWKKNKRCGFGKIFSGNKIKYGIWQEQNEENKKTQWFKNDLDAMDFFKKSEFYDKYNKFFEFSKEELINTYDIFFKDDFILPCNLNEKLKEE